MNTHDERPLIDPVRLLLTVAEAAYVLGVSKSVAEGLIREGHLQVKRVGTRPMVSRESLERFATDPAPVNWQPQRAAEPVSLVAREAGHRGGHVRKAAQNTDAPAGRGPGR